MTANAGGEAVSSEPRAWEMWFEGKRAYTAVRRDDMERAVERGHEARPLVYSAATPTDAGLREALEAIAGDDKVDGESVYVDIARAALSQGGGG